MTPTLENLEPRDCPSALDPTGATASPQLSPTRFLPDGRIAYLAATPDQQVAAVVRDGEQVVSTVPLFPQTATLVSLGLGIGPEPGEIDAWWQDGQQVYGAQSLDCGAHFGAVMLTLDLSTWDAPAGDPPPVSPPGVVAVVPQVPAVPQVVAPLPVAPPVSTASPSAEQVAPTPAVAQTRSQPPPPPWATVDPVSLVESEAWLKEHRLD